MIVNVRAQIIYDYVVDVPDNYDIDLDIYCEAEDPVYSDLCKTLEKDHLTYDASTISIVNYDTGELLYEGC